jgi:hypothetical protein
MNEEHPKNWKTSVEHPTEDDLLCFIDGELNTSRSEGLRVHLEACWECRNRAEKYQAAISEFIDYRNLVMKPLIQAPGGWGGFSAQLHSQAAEVIPPTLWERFQGIIHRLQAAVMAIEPRTIRLAGISMATLLVGAIGLYVLLVGSNAVVSAEELISLATQAREAELKKADQPVVYQQFRITRKINDKEVAANVEVWQDIDNLRIRKVVTPVDQAQPAAVLADLEQILKANKYEPPPLSVVGFKAWRSTLTDKTDAVERLTTEGGVDTLRLQTETTRKFDQNQLIASVLTVRAADYHPLEQVFRVLNGGEVQEYEVRESSFAVMSLNSLNPGFFADSQPMMVDTKPAMPTAALSPGANSNTEITNMNTATVTAVNAVATAELEVDVMNALHSAGADLGEQIEVRRAPNGQVTISGVVETPERKGQILNALGALKDNPAVRISISTVSEALAAERSNRARPQPSVERVQVDTDSYPAEGELLAHFKDAGAARTFAARMTAQSSRAMSYLWAMKRLRGQFSGSQVEKLTPEARAKLLGVVRSYASNYQREIGTLRRELQPVFGGGGGGTAGKIGSDAELLQTIDQLFAAGTGTNQVIRMAFTTGSSATSALGAPQFWQTVARAEGLAASIERYR